MTPHKTLCTLGLVAILATSAGAADVYTTGHQTCTAVTRAEVVDLNPHLRASQVRMLFGPGRGTLLLCHGTTGRVSGTWNFSNALDQGGFNHMALTGVVDAQQPNCAFQLRRLRPLSVRRGPKPVSICWTEPDPLDTGTKLRVLVSREELLALNPDLSPTLLNQYVPEAALIVEIAIFLGQEPGGVLVTVVSADGYDGRRHGNALGAGPFEVSERAGCVGLPPTNPGGTDPLATMCW